MPQALPRYLQLAETLTRDIAAGRLVDGERMAPEREMAAGMGLSLGTVRKALGELAARGLLTRVQGSGNYVRSGAEAAGIYALFRLERLSGGGLPSADILSVARLPKPAGSPRFGPAADAQRIRRLRRLDGDPAAVEEIWLDGAAAGPEPLRAKDLSESLYLHYRRALDLWIGTVSDRVGLAPAPDWATPPFRPPPGAVCGYVERLACDRDGQPVEWSQTWFDSERAVYVARHR